MVKRPFAGLVMALAVVIVSCPAASAAGLIVDFEVPRGGEVFVVGQMQKVKLNARTRGKSVEIEISRDGGATFAALGTIDNTVKDRALRNILSFTVTGPASTNCVLRARAASARGMATGITGAFSIVVALDTASLPAGSVSAAALAGNSVGSTAIADGSVTTPKLADVAVTGVKIATQAVTQEKVSSGAASAGMLLTADGFGAASFATPPAAPSVATTAGNSITAALNNAGTTLATLNASVLTGTAGINITGNAATATNFTGALAGDVTGNQGATKVVALQNRNVGNAAPAAGEALVWNNAASQWEPASTAAIDTTGNAATATLAQGVADNAVTAAKIADGTVTPAKMAVYPAVRVRNGVDVPIPNNAFTALTFDTERFDTDNCHDAVNPSRLTCNTAGVYYICANVNGTYLSFNTCCGKE